MSVEAFTAPVFPSGGPLPEFPSIDLLLGADFWIKVAALVVIYLFLPVSAAAYFWFRRHRHERKVQRILRVLDVDERDREIYAQRGIGWHLALAIFYSTAVSAVGLAALMFSRWIEDALAWGPGSFPADDSLLMLGMAFLGAYLWGVQYVLRRYITNDLEPAVFYGLSLRMLLAGALAVVIFNGYEVLAGNGPEGADAGGVVDTMWPAVAFVLGMFPQRGLSWLRDRIPMLAPQTHPSVRKLGLDIIEGISVHDRLRLEEYGLDNCFDLATVDFVPLAISTPYSARTLVDWIMQAKLCVYCGEAISDLRQVGMRTIFDLEGMPAEELETLANETSVTKASLMRAKRHVEQDAETRRLREIAFRLGVFASESMIAGQREERPEQERDEAALEPEANFWHAARARRDGRLAGAGVM